MQKYCKGVPLHSPPPSLSQGASWPLVRQPPGGGPVDSDSFDTEHAAVKAPRSPSSVASRRQAGAPPLPCCAPPAALRRSASPASRRKTQNERAPGSWCAGVAGLVPRALHLPGEGWRASRGGGTVHVVAQSQPRGCAELCARTHAPQVRKPEQLAGVCGLIIPGGESTTMALVAERWGLVRHERGTLRRFATRELSRYMPQIPALREFAASGRPIWGTCAGLIFLADRAVGARVSACLVFPPVSAQASASRRPEGRWSGSHWRLGHHCQPQLFWQPD